MRYHSNCTIPKYSHFSNICIFDSHVVPLGYYPSKWPNPKYPHSSRFYVFGCKFITCLTEETIPEFSHVQKFVCLCHSLCLAESWVFSFINLFFCVSHIWTHYCYQMAESFPTFVNLCVCVSLSIWLKIEFSHIQKFVCLRLFVFGRKLNYLTFRNLCVCISLCLAESRRPVFSCSVATSAQAVNVAT